MTPVRSGCVNHTTIWKAVRIERAGVYYARQLVIIAAISDLTPLYNKSCCILFTIKIPYSGLSSLLRHGHRRGGHTPTKAMITTRILLLQIDKGCICKYFLSVEIKRELAPGNCSLEVRAQFRLFYDDIPSCHNVIHRS